MLSRIYCPFLLPARRCTLAGGDEKSKQIPNKNFVDVVFNILRVLYRDKKKIRFSPLLAILRKTTKAGKPLLFFSKELPIHPSSGPHFFGLTRIIDSAELLKY